MNMDVNLHRLPDKMFCLSKFLVPLAGLIPHPHPADSADIRSKQAERQFIIKENIRLRTTGISMKKANVLQTKPFPVNFFIHSLIIYWNTRRKNVKIILASASPRRKELLEQVGVEFEQRVSGKEERYTATEPKEIVKELALMKAENVASDIEAEKGLLIDTVVIGADTIVVLDGQILGKPRNEEHAFEMLQNLQGRSHEVYTGVAFLSYNKEGKKEVISHAVETKVHVHEMSEKEIREYVATKDPMDKAGGYGIQGVFAAYIDGIEGDYYNVVGLPVSYVYQQLKEICLMC